jgi:hypothetical protein
MEITFGKPYKCKEGGGSFVSVRQKDGEKIMCVLSETPLQCSGLSKWKKFYLNLCLKNSDQDTIKKAIEFKELHNIVLEQAKIKFKNNKTRNRIDHSTFVDNCLSITVSNRLAFNSVIKDANNKHRSLEKLEKGKYSMVALLEIDSLYVHPSMGIIPQIKFNQCCFWDTKVVPTRSLDMDSIIEKFSYLIYKSPEDSNDSKAIKL